MSPKNSFFFLPQIKPFKTMLPPHVIQKEERKKKSSAENSTSRSCMPYEGS